LELLTLYGTEISSDAGQRLRREYPECIIVW
jgi:hypothetical protein